MSNQTVKEVIEEITKKRAEREAQEATNKKNERLAYGFALSVYITLVMDVITFSGAIVFSSYYPESCSIVRLVTLWIFYPILAFILIFNVIISVNEKRSRGF